MHNLEEYVREYPSQFHSRLNTGPLEDGSMKEKDLRKAEKRLLGGRFPCVDRPSFSRSRSCEKTCVNSGPQKKSTTKFLSDTLEKGKKCSTNSLRLIKKAQSSSAHRTTSGNWPSHIMHNLSRPALAVQSDTQKRVLIDP